MEELEKRAVAYHHGGYNCAQAVFASCGAWTGVDEKTSLRIAGGLGGGIRCGEACGAASGMVLAIASACGFDDAADSEKKARTADLTREAMSRFKAEFGYLRCEDLLRRKASADAGADEPAGGRAASCDEFIAGAVRIAAEIITRERGEGK